MHMIYRPEGFNPREIRKTQQMMAAGYWSADYEIGLIEAGAEAMFRHVCWRLTEGELRGLAKSAIAHLFRVGVPELIEFMGEEKDEQ